jgi:2-desacetyl-2-hydroxyethyl bacteriochlorophyllide A dehydrogenase
MAYGEGRAAVIAGPRRITVETFELQHPGPGQALVALEGCGVCHSNLPAWEGRDWFRYPLPPGNPGHEGWGRIVAAGAGTHELRPGDRVAFLSSAAYASHAVIDASSAVKLPAALDGMQFAGEPIACAMNIFARAAVEARHTVAIIGIGFLGALLTRLCAHAGARVIAIARRPFSQELARKQGADLVVPMDDHGAIIARVRDATRGALCDRTIEAVGEQWPLDLAAELTGERGRLVIAGYHQDGPRQVNMQLWNWRGLDVVNAHERDPRVYVEGIREAARAVAEGRLDPAPLYTHRFGLDEVDRALETAVERPEGFMKALVVA